MKLYRSKPKSDTFRSLKRCFLGSSEFCTEKRTSNFEDLPLNFHNLCHLSCQENYFGVSQKPMEFNAFKEVKTDGQTFGDISSKGDSASHDSRYFRPFEANISVVLLDIHAELSKVGEMKLHTTTVFLMVVSCLRVDT